MEREKEVRGLSPRSYPQGGAGASFIQAGLSALNFAHMMDAGNLSSSPKP